MRKYRIQETASEKIFQTGMSRKDANHEALNLNIKNILLGLRYKVVEELFTVTDTKSGIVLGTDLNFDEAELLVYQMEYTDKKNGVYAENQYKITVNK